MNIFSLELELRRREGKGSKGAQSKCYVLIYCLSPSNRRFVLYTLYTVLDLLVSQISDFEFIFKSQSG